MRRKMAPFLSALLVMFLALPVLSAASAKTVFPPGLRVGLEPAAGLKPARKFPGFEDPERHAAVTIFDLPAGAYDQIMRSAFAMPERGFTEVSREMFSFDGGLGFLINGHTRKDGSDLQIWFLVAHPLATRVMDLATLIRVDVPEKARAVYPESVVRKMLASVTFRPEPTEERLGLLPFKLTDLAGLKVTRVLSNGVVILVGPSSENSTVPSSAVVSLGRGAPGNSDDYARFARDLLGNGPVRDLAITSGDRMRINGQPGFEIRARGSGPNGVPLSLVQWLRFAPGGSFIRIVAVAPQAEWDQMFNRFRALRDGIEPR